MSEPNIGDCVAHRMSGVQGGTGLVAGFVGAIGFQRLVVEFSNGERVLIDPGEVVVVGRCGDVKGEQG